MPELPDSFRIEVENLPVEIRKILAERWSDMALAEHASIASFSRFSLQLLAVAAPPSLISAAHRAAIDEVRHAQMCFALASIYAGEDLSPGPLPLDGDIIGGLDLPTVVTSAVLEGCIGETIAASEAATAQDLAQTTTIKKTLNAIAQDESRHAQLAWRFVQWALQQGEPLVRKMIQEGFDRILHGQSTPQPPAHPWDLQLQQHGQLGAHIRWKCQQQACQEIILPAAQVLLYENQ